jgi:carbonic anhydrase
MENLARPGRPVVRSRARMGNLDAIRDANNRYVAQLHEPGVASAPSRHLVIITCMDTRLDPNAALGLRPGEAHVLRNGGGIVTDDVLRSLVISHNLLGTDEAVVLMHTDCGLRKNTNDDVRRAVRDRHGVELDVDFRCFDSLSAALERSVAAIRACDGLAPDFKVTGLVFDVADGRVRAPATSD